MKRIVITYGLISGLIVGGMFFAGAPLWKNGTLNYDNGTVVGYTTMVIALSLVFFGVKSYRDRHLDGAISFGQALKVGILITIVASVAYCLAWEIAYNTVFSNFGELMSEHYMAKLKNEGASEAALKEATEELQRNMEMYQNPVIRFAITMTEILPVGVVITLLSATLLRKKETLPA